MIFSVNYESDGLKNEDEDGPLFLPTKLVFGPDDDWWSGGIGLGGGLGGAVRVWIITLSIMSLSTLAMGSGIRVGDIGCDRAKKSFRVGGLRRPDGGNFIGWCWHCWLPSWRGTTLVAIRGGMQHRPAGGP